MTLDAGRLRKALRGSRFQNVETRGSVESTQAILVAEGGPDGRVVVADHQTAGRGRRGRTWESPPGRSLLLSALVRGVEPERAPLLSLAVGLAVATAIERLCAFDAHLKWPNDVLLHGRKVCGVLGEVANDYVVLGLGCNVSQTAEELPEGGTSLALQGVRLEREDLCVAVLRHLESVLADAGFLDLYRLRCETLGRRVVVDMGLRKVTGTAEEIRDDGALVVSGREVLSGDVVHVR